MPCYGVETREVDIGRIDVPTFIEALKSLGVTPDVCNNNVFIYDINNETNTYINGTLIDGVLRISVDTDLNVLKRAYSRQAVKQTFAKFGWKLKAHPDQPYKFTGIK